MYGSSKIYRVVLSSLLAIAAFSAFSVAQKPMPTPERDRRIVALLNDSRLAAPELAVDTFLKMVETGKVTDPVWCGELIDEAERMIDSVQYPMPMRAAFGGKFERNNLLNDTEAFVMAMAYGSKLDRLSFKARLIKLILKTDPERAKQMVFQIGGSLDVKPSSCEDALSPSPDEIYKVVAEVAKAVFTEKQVDAGQRALFIVPWIENIESPRQIFPALGLLREMNGPATERQMLFNAASRTIDRNFKNDRAFTYSWEPIASVVGKMTQGEADPLKNDLKRAFRSMLLKNLTGTRCKDNEIKKDEPLPDYIEAVNNVIPDKPITYEDISTADYAGTAKLTHILQKSSISRQFRDESKTIRDQKIVDNKVVNHDVNDPEWAARINDFVDRVLAAEGTDGETEGEMLFIKAAFLGSTLYGVDPGDLRKSIVRKYLRLLASSRLQKTSFVEWRQWMADAERMTPDSFDEIASEFPNYNIKVILAVKKLLKKDDKNTKPPA